MLSPLYSHIARLRREKYARRADLRRRLRRPVVSVGNLAVGGRGKTPVVAALARLLVEAGEQPAILTRGYARTRPDDGVTIVSDRSGIRADLARAGDEPLMLARQLPGVPVLVSPDRYLAGRLAEHHLAATVHILDDGFQHLTLDRDIDIVIVRGVDLDPETQTLPGGPLRETAPALFAADAVLAADENVDIGGQFPFTVFQVRRAIGAPVAMTASGASADPPEPPGPIAAVAGIANPQPFFTGLREAGWEVAAVLPFRDHHPFTPRDAEGIWSEAKRTGAAAVLTTEKDFVRLLPFRPFPLPVAYVPLTMEPSPLPEFRRWLDGALRDARDNLVG